MTYRIGHAFLFIALAIAPVRADAVAELFDGVVLGASLSEVRAAIEAPASTLTVVRVEPAMPLAAESETHLIATRLAGIEEVAFVFGDDALVLIEARGGAIAAVEQHLSPPSMQLEAYEAFPSNLAVLRRDDDALWLLTPEALHPHLFLWENPHLPSHQATKRNASAKRPALLEFGATLEALQPRMQKDAAMTMTRQIAEPWLPSSPQRQTQVDCFGVDYAGFPRKIEAVFGDGVLELAWILTGKGEEDRLRRALTELHGEPVFESDDWIAFDNWRVALRRDKPEVLMLSERLAPLYRAQYGTDQAR